MIKINIKLFWLSLKINICKILIYICKKYEHYKYNQLKMYINNLIIAESGYNQEVIKILAKK